MMMTRTDTTVDTPAGRLHVAVQGSGPPALLWHSLLVDSTQWNRVVDDLGEVRTLVLVDGPGHGRSGAPPKDAGFEQCADAAAIVLDELGLGRADWIGNAWGGHVGYVFAANHPDRCRSLTSIAAPVTPLPPIQRRRIRLLVALYGLVGAAAPLRTAVLETLLAEDTRATDREAVDLVTRAFREGGRVGMHRVMRSMMLQRGDLSHLLPRIAAPALIVSGSEDPTFPAARAAAVAAALPSASAVTIDGAGHLPPLERPVELVRVVRSLWELGD
jgi:pimeloyl-ACP methyl ester carboxylesterase